MKFIWLFLLGQVVYQAVYAQKDFAEHIDLEEAIEELFPQQELNINYNDIYDKLFSIYTHPVDLNFDTRDKFQSLFFLTETQIEAIFNYREKYGKFFSIYELLSVDGFDKSLVQKLGPFITIRHEELPSIKSAIKRPKIHELLLRYQTIFEQKIGYTPPDTNSRGELSSRYAGKKGRYMSRYLMATPGIYSFGFTVEKDPGEKITWDPGTSRYGMDYYSVHLMLENQRWIDKIIVGDFSLDAGQGLVFGAGFSLGKGVEPITSIRRNGMGLLPYRSVYERKDFSGIGLEKKIGHIVFRAFYSRVKRDAVIRSESSDSLRQFITYIQTTGLHRTASEVNAKHRIIDRAIGVNMQAKLLKDHLEFGANSVITHYSTPVLPTPKKYNQFDFTGINNTVASAYFNYYMHKAQLFGEAAMSAGGGRALALGMVVEIAPQVQTSFHYRNYQRNYHSFYGQSFGENTYLSNEQGMYWGIKLTPVRDLIISSYMDIYKFPWLKYLVDSPSTGYDFMLSGTYKLRNLGYVRILYRNKSKDNNVITNESPTILIKEKNSQRWLINYKYNINDNFTLQTKVQYSKIHFNANDNDGFLLAQDVVFNNKKMLLTGRFCLFDTDSYESRQFIYERDLLYLYHVPFFYRKGLRYYLLSKYELNNNISIWLKFAQTRYLNKNEIGSGLEKIRGEQRTELNLQMRIKI